MSGHEVSRRSALLGGIAGAGALALGLPFPSARAARNDPRPNILLIMTDDQHVESLRVMDNLQSLLVDRGTSFTNNFCSWPICAPSRGTLLTGQYAHNHGVINSSPTTAGGYKDLDGTNTLPVWLQRAGYHTAHLGKYVNGYGSVDPTEIPPGWTDWHAAVNPPGHYLNRTLNENGTLVNYQGIYQTDQYAEKASDIVRRAAAGDQPFFAWINFFAPHGGQPREADDPPGATGNAIGPAVADRHRDFFADESLPYVASFNEADVSDKPRHIRNRPLLSAAEQAAIRERYQQRLESLLAVDEAIGQILGTLEDTGQADNTLIVFTADNGYFQGEHRIALEKNELYDPATRVPLILRGPGIPAGATRAQLVSNIDLAPTFVQAAQAEANQTLPGRPLPQLARNPEVAQGRPILLERGPGELNAPGRRSTAIRTPGFQYTENVSADGEREFELYDMRQDPDQLNSRHNDPAYAETRAELEMRLASLRNQ